MALAIRRADPGDLPAITAIYNDGIATRMATADATPRTLAERTEWFKQFDDQFPIWVGESGGQVVCYGGLHRWMAREGYRFTAENSVYVGASAQGQGFGRAMLTHLVAVARSLGLHCLIARIFSDNAGSIHLHREVGFGDIGLHRECVRLDGQWRDVLLMDIRL